MGRLLVFNALFSSERAPVTSVSKPVVFKLKLQNNVIMTLYYTSLYYVNNRLNSESATEEQLKRAHLLIWDELQQEAIRKSIASFRKCLRACINAKGGHFEHTL